MRKRVGEREREGDGEGGDRPINVLFAMFAIPSLRRRNPNAKSSRNVSSTLVAVLPNHRSKSE